MFSPTISPLLRWQSIFRMFPCSCRHLEWGERHQRYVRRAARWKACTVQITAGWWWSEACWNLVAAWTDKTTRSFCCYRLSTQINPHIGFLPNTKENCAFKRTKNKQINKNLPFSKKKFFPFWQLWKLQLGNNFCGVRLTERECVSEEFPLLQRAASNQRNPISRFVISATWPPGLFFIPTWQWKRRKKEKRNEGFFHFMLLAVRRRRDILIIWGLFITLPLGGWWGRGTSALSYSKFILQDGGNQSVSRLSRPTCSS